jgi:hypothetical protein
MSDSDLHIRIQALTQLLNELRAILRALDQRITAAEQSLDNRWISASS